MLAMFCFCTLNLSNSFLSKQGPPGPPPRNAYVMNDDHQPKLRGSGVVVTLVCECTKDPEGI